MTPEITKLVTIFWSTARSKEDVCYFLYGDKMIASSWTAKLKEQPLAIHECSFTMYLSSLSVDRVLYLQFANALYHDMGRLNVVSFTAKNIYG